MVFGKCVVFGNSTDRIGFICLNLNTAANLNARLAVSTFAHDTVRVEALFN